MIPNPISNHGNPCTMHIEIVLWYLASVKTCCSTLLMLVIVEPSTRTMTEDAGSTVAACAEKPLSKRGPAFTSAEDIIVARAFIAASENAICGAHQKGRVFKAHMFELYKDMTADATKTNKTLLEQSSHATREEYIKKGVGTVFPLRSPESIFNRFKQQISAEVMKYMGITETTEMSSGWSMDDHKTACLGLFKERYGRAFDFFPCYEYLKDKNKFSSFRTKCVDDNGGVVKSRPIGKKQARQSEHDAKLIKAIVSEVVVKKEKTSSGGSESVVSELFDTATPRTSRQAMGDVLQNISNVIANVGTAVLENMKAEQDMRFLQSLDTPDRKMYAKEQLALRMAETRQKRRRIEFARSSVDVLSSAEKSTGDEDDEDVLLDENDKI